MKDVEKMFDEAIEIIKECIDGVEIYPIKRPITINKKATRWGCCKYRRGSEMRTIEISSRLLDDGISDDATMNTLIHEILHACKGCYGHQGQWLRYANIINRKCPQYNIKRTTSPDEVGADPTSYRYAIRCTKCGNVHYSNRLSATIKHPEHYRCKCGGELERVDVREIKREIQTPAPLFGGQLCLMDFI